MVLDFEAAVDGEREIVLRSGLVEGVRYARVLRIRASAVFLAISFFSEKMYRRKWSCHH